MPAVRPPVAPLRGRYISLEPLSPADLPELRTAIAHPRVFAGGFGGGSAGYRADRADRADFLAWAGEYLQFGRCNVYGVRIRGGAHDGALVGTTSLGDFDEATESAHIGWTAYDPRVWGSAVNPEAKLLLFGLAFESGFGRVKIQADAANVRSRSAIERLGAVLEGVHRRDKRRADGAWRDTAIYSVLRTEWPAVRSGLHARLDALGGEPICYRNADEPVSA
ncbi:GNAT family N-acetyltransferase [Rhodococcus daqingensis]|uniref:GNAT family N-acetyltransferase n=1 Tax=Rhodococcus daqingensis TaxID=2479363 RepID=A0ABW2RSJ7_9NOCA